MPLFNYKYFKEGLISECNDKSEMMEQYLEAYGDNLLENEPFYKDYLSKFEIIPYRVPYECRNDFDYDLLGKLICGSFSCDTKFMFIEDNTTPDLCISVDGPKKTILIKRVEELWSFQLLRCFEIYLDEMINLQLLIYTNEFERSGVYHEREIKLKKHRAMIENLKTRDKYFDNIIKGKNCIESMIRSKK